ncbi:MAG: roadblock/LC7 domain-containing protein [Planctomycetes bacterium]|nr:roadblock/LC7 domain-containing protein [Planctomycetota bacterium]
MQDVLDKLNQEMGVRGSLVVTDDGVVAAASLVREEDRDLLGALATDISLKVRSALREGGLEGHSRLVLDAEYGRIVLYDLEVASLVVVLDRTINADATMIEIESAASRIRRLGRLFAAAQAGEE